MNLYVSTYGTKIGIDGGKLVLSQKETSREYPVETIDSLSILPGVNISQQAILKLSASKIPIFWMNKNYNTYAFLSSPKVIDIERTKLQFELSENKKFALGIGKNFITAKVKNQLAFANELADRYQIKNYEIQKKEIEKTLSKIRKAKSTEALDGMEGYAAKTYFSVLKCCVPTWCGFETRTKHPPRDYFSAVLSVLYTFLYNYIVSAIQNAGLNPNIGFVHQLKKGHCALASDLMEEYRAMLCDALALELVYNVLSEGNFTREEDGSITIDRDGWTLILARFEEKINQPIGYVKKNGNGSDYKASFSGQVYELITAMEKKNVEAYRPIILKE